MRKFVTKEMKETSVSLTEVKIEKGELVSSDVGVLKLYGTVTDTQIKKAINKEFKGRNVLIKDKVETVRNYRMPVDMFIEMAEEYVPAKKDDTMNPQPVEMENE